MYVSLLTCTRALLVADDGNAGADVVLAFALGSLAGGDHVMVSPDGKQAMVVETSALGTVIVGNHQHVVRRLCRPVSKCTC